MNNHIINLLSIDSSIYCPHYRASFTDDEIAMTYCRQQAVLQQPALNVGGLVTINSKKQSLI